jgi:hypothetical protein
LDRRNYAFEEGYSYNPPLGASIGVSSREIGSGTYGGSFRLRIKAADGTVETKYLFLTCHHVVSGKYHLNVL